MFTAVYERNSKKVVGIGDYFPIPSGCIKSKPVKDPCPDPLFGLNKEGELVCLYKYDESQNVLVKIGPDVPLLMIS